MCNTTAVGRSRLPQVVLTSAAIDERMSKIFEAAGDAIHGAARQLIGNYVGDGIEWEHSAAACGKALVVNGVSAMVASASDMPENEVAELCDELNDLIAGRMLAYLERVAA